MSAENENEVSLTTSKLQSIFYFLEQIKVTAQKIVLKNTSCTVRSFFGTIYFWHLVLFHLETHKIQIFVINWNQKIF